jgi:hypothetical protein
LNKLFNFLKKYKELFLILSGLNLGLLAFSLALGSLNMALINIGSAALMLLAYDLNSD